MRFTVKDAVTKEPVSFAVARTNRGGTFMGAQADFDGVVDFDFRPNENIELQMVGYGTQYTTGQDILNNGGIAYMGGGTVTLDPVVVTPHQGKFPWWLLLIPLLFARR